MSNGKRGDHPLTDLLVHAVEVFSPEVDGLVRDLAKLRSRSELDSIVDWSSPPPLPELARVVRAALAEARRMAQSRGWNPDDPIPGATAVEDLLAELEAKATVPGEIELWVPDRLKLGGTSMPHDFALAVLTDKALELDLEPAGWVRGDGGRTYRYRR